VKFIQATTIKKSDQPITDIPEGHHVIKIKGKYQLVKTIVIEMEYPISVTNITKIVT
jgi:hypothetical protein